MPGRLDARTLGEVMRRAGRDDFDRWADQLARCGHCARPVRLRGRVERRDRAGRLVDAYDTASEPDRVLMVRCGNRRASVCPSCSREYAGDMWQLLYAGAAGGRKGVPESVRSHPLVFATLTAPGFGAVHGTRTDRQGGRGRCRPPRGFRGHFSTKSRRYSVTLGSIRAERRTYQQQRARQLAGLRELPADHDADSTLVVARWQFAGLGFLSGGDAALALSAAARARERREAAKEAEPPTAQGERD